MNNHQQENVGSHQKKKKIPYIQRQRKSPNKMVGGAKSSLESNPYTPETLRGLRKIKIKIKKTTTLWAPGPRDPTEIEPKLP